MNFIKLWQPGLIFIICITLLIYLYRKYSTYKHQSFLDKTDKKLILGLSIIYAIISFINFGQINHYGSWTADVPGRSFSLNFAKPTDVAKIYYYYGVGNGNLKVDYTTDSNETGTIVFNSDLSIYKWMSIEIPGNKKISQLVFSADKPDIELKQMAIFNHEQNLVNNYTISASNDDDLSKIATLFNTLPPRNYKKTLLSSMYFDELYYARTANEYLHLKAPYTWVHPPLGMLILAIGIIIFGMNPFGWRIIPNMAGITLVGVMYMFAKRLFKSRRAAIFASILIMFDFMHFTFNRMASIDSTETLFLVLEFYFLYSYAEHSILKEKNKSIISLLWCGVFFGLAIATKWEGAFSAPLILITALYIEVWKNKTPQLIKTIALYSVFLLLIPLMIYVLAFTVGFVINDDPNFATYIINLQGFMYDYHTHYAKNVTHPYSSNWWSWPLLIKPLSLFYWQNDHGLASSVVLMGNPAIWWVGIVTVITTLITAIKHKQPLAWFLFLMVFVLYAPWVFIGRLSFIYYFYAITPFWILTIVYMLDKIDKINSNYVYSYLILVIMLFIAFYPAIAGITVSRDYVVHYLWWMNSWNF